MLLVWICTCARTHVCVVCRCGHLKLGDFGSAARLGPGGVVRAPAPVGTPHYIAPELLRALEDPKNHPHGVCMNAMHLSRLLYIITP